MSAILSCEQKIYTSGRIYRTKISFFRMFGCMLSSLNIYSLVLVSSGAFTTALATFLFANFKGIGKYSAVLMYLTSLWIICSGICLLQPTLSGMLLTVKIEYISIALFPSLWMLFILKFLKLENSLSFLVKGLLFLLPILTLMVVWTNEAHLLFYAEMEVSTFGRLSFLKFVKGPWYTLHMLYFYGCLASGLIMLHLKLDGSNPLIVRQKRLIMIAVVVPAIANICYQFGLRPQHGLDLTPFGFSLTTVIMGLGLYKFRLFDILPVPREKIIESIREGVVVLDRKERIVYVNRSMQQIIGRTQEEIIGKNVKTFLPINSAESNQELKIELDGQRVFTYSVTRTLFENESSWKKGKVFLFSDISESKDFEQKLLEAKELAEQAAIAKSDFLSTMSHEIRTPMNAVINFTHLLLQDARADQEEYLRLLKYSGENLLVLVNDILDYNKIEAGKIELEWIDFNLMDLLKNIRGGLDQMASDKGIQLEVLVDKNLPQFVKADPVRIGQVLTNLASNAVKFTEYGSVTISANLESKSDSITTVHFAVKDTGIGIPEDKQKLVFDSFTQASSDTTRKYGGTGLGLAISKRLVEFYKTELKLNSVPGKGSCFYFTVNLKTSNKVTSSIGKKSTEPDRNLQGARVLLAEDNKINVVLARQFFKRWKVECDVAENGLIAVEMVKQNLYDLILMDLQMPVMDGYEASRLIRHEYGLSEIPIVALTASAMAEVRDKVIDAGMNQIVTKPFDPDELFNVMSWALDGATSEV